MNMFRKMSIGVTVCILFASAAGCATIERSLTPYYKPAAHASGGSGDVYVATAGGYPGGDRKARVQWILGKVKNSDGETTGNIVSQIAPADVAQQAFTQELNAAGYSARPVDVLPEGVAKGVEISNVTMDMEEVTSLVKSDVTGDLNVAVDVWKEGRKIKRLDYKTRTSDFSVKDRERLAQEVLEGSLQDIMKQAVPDVIKVLEEK